MIIKVHRVWVVKDVGPSFQGCRPDVITLEQFETREEAEAFCKKYKEKKEANPNICWMGTLHIVEKDNEILE